MIPFTKMFILMLTMTVTTVIAFNNVEELLMATRFAHTVDYALKQTEEKSFDIELIANAPRNFKRSIIFKEKDETCSDALSQSRCTYLRQFGACKSHPKKMKFYCRRSCKFCIPTPSPCTFTKYGCCPDEKTAAKGFYFKGCNEHCLDKNDKSLCELAERSGLCEKNQVAILKGCRKTCSVCRSCEDEDPLKCRAAVFYGLCQKLRFTMLNQCRRTCGFCGKNDPCGAHTCPFGKKCIINSYGTPECVCRDACNKWDDLTSIVCGRDGVEYPNLCTLKMKSCKGPQIKVNRFGSCKAFAFMEGVSCRKVKDPPICKAWKRYGYCIKFKKRLARYCPHECGFCAAKSAVSACHYTKHGCCIDGITPCKGKNYEGCKNRGECKDRYPTVCRRFAIACSEDQNKQFMRKFCPATCFYCPKREKN